MNTSDSIKIPILKHSRRNLFKNTVDILIFLEADRKTPHAQRLHRDRQIGQGACESGLNSPLKSVQCWWQHTADFSSQSDSEGEKVASVRSLVNLAAVLFGLVSGVGVIVAVFQYDGSHPINVATLIAVFVMLQSLLIGLSLLMLLPGQNFLGRTLQTINLGAMLSEVMRRTMLKPSRSTAFGFGSGSRTRAHQTLLRWQLFSWSQLMGCAFNVGALLGALLLIVFTDLAFGWSSTLMLESVQFQKLIHLVSAPWSGIWPEAVPSQTLIEQSRFYRLGSEQAAGFVAQNLTAWWPFVVACLSSYGLLPRMVLFGLSRICFHRALVNLLTDNPQVIALLDRMGTPEVILAAPAGEAAEYLPGDTQHKPPEVLSGKVPLVIWSESVDNAALVARLKNRYGLKVCDTYQAGGLCSLAEDENTINIMVSARGTGILIAVKSWEPPLSDLLDFVSLLRLKIGAKKQIVLLLLGPGLAEIETKQLRIWRHALNRLSDSQVFVESHLKGTEVNG